MVYLALLGLPALAPFAMVVGVVLAWPGAGWADDMARALAEVRTVRADIYGRQSKHFGTLPSPGDLARAQVDFRKIYRADKDRTLDISKARREALERHHAYRSQFGASLFHMGLTGAWAQREKSQATLTVAAIEHGTPAEGALMLEDVIVGAFGRLFEEAHDPRIPLGYALVEAQTERMGGILRLHVVRNGKLTDVDVELGVTGDYSATWPYDCKKSEAIGDALVQHLMPLPRPGRCEYWTDLILMASGDHAAIEQVAERMRTMMKRPAGASIGTTGWNGGYDLIRLAEYYLLTGDADMLPYVQGLAKGVENIQSNWYQIPDAPA